MYELEQSLLDEGKRYIIGIDEVGRGPLAGDVVAAAVCIDLENPIEGIKDSKKLSQKKREELAPIIKDEAVAFSIAGASPEVIDKINIKKATIYSMEKALENICEKLEKIGITPDMVLIDSEKISTDLESLSIDKGDDKSSAIGGASIIAKVYRDSLALQWNEQWPEYGFKNHKGYGTKKHIEAIVRHGPTSIHRQTFLKNLDQWRETSYDKGQLGETIACDYLKNRGYKILERNYDSKVGEIDIIALDGDILVFIEVKLRKDTKYGHGYEYVSQKQKGRIKRGATVYIMEKELTDLQPRFDIIEIYTVNNKLNHYKNSF